MSRVPGWGVVSAGLAPVFLIGGWTLAAAVQPPGFSSVRDTISALAGLGAAHRWLMTAAFVGTGICHVVTAFALRPAAIPGRLVLAVGGVATAVLAAFPVPAVGVSDAHRLVAAVALGALALWPALTVWPAPAGRAPGAPPRPGQLIGLTLVLLALLGWFVVELAGGGSAVGLAERFAAGAQSLCPLVVVLAARRPVA